MTSVFEAGQRRVDPPIPQIRITGNPTPETSGTKSARQPDTNVSGDAVDHDPQTRTYVEIGGKRFEIRSETK